MGINEIREYISKLTAKHMITVMGTVTIAGKDIVPTVIPRSPISYKTSICTRYMQKDAFDTYFAQTAAGPFIRSFKQWQIPKIPAARKNEPIVIPSMKRVYKEPFFIEK